MASIEDEDPTARFKMRFSIRRFEKAIKNLTPKQQGFLVKYGFDMFLNLKHHVVFPLRLIDWIMENMVPALGIFQHGTKHINFNKFMIQQFLGIPSGDIPVKTSSNDPDIIRKVNLLKKKYMTGTKLFTKKAIELLVGDEDEESFMITFTLVLLATIVCPATSDTVDWRYLYSLTDVSMLNRFDWASLCLQHTVKEIEKFIKRISDMPNGIPKQPLYVGGCLPVLAVVYMDMLDLNAGASQYQLDYGVPRVHHVRTTDFHQVTQSDRNHSSKKYVFGVLDFRKMSCTPYSEIAIKEANDTEMRRHRLALLSLGDVSTGPSSSHHPMDSDQAPDASNHAENSTPDIKKIIDCIVQSHKVELSRDAHNLVERRFCLMSEAIDSALSQHLAADIVNKSSSLPGVTIGGGTRDTDPTPSVHGAAQVTTNIGATSDTNVAATSPIDSHEGQGEPPSVNYSGASPQDQDGESLLSPQQQEHVAAENGRIPHRKLTDISTSLNSEQYEPTTSDNEGPRDERINETGPTAPSKLASAQAQAQSGDSSPGAREEDQEPALHPSCRLPSPPPAPASSTLAVSCHLRDSRISAERSGKMWRKGNKRFGGGGGDPPAKRQAAGKDGPSGETDDGTVVAQISKNKRVSVRSWNGNVMVDVREFYVKDGKDLPGRKGISLTMDQWKILRDNIKAIDEAIKENI